MTKFQKKKCLEAAEQKTSKLLVVVCCCKTVEIGWIGAGIWVMVLMVFGIFLIFSNWFRGSDTFSGVLMVICLLAIMAAWGLSMGEGLAELTGTANRPI